MTNTVSHTTPSRPVPFTGTGPTLSTPFIANGSLPRTDLLAARIAANQVEQLDELALIGYPSLDPAHRDVVQTSLRLAARRILEEAMGA